MPSGGPARADVKKPASKPVRIPVSNRFTYLQHPMIASVHSNDADLPLVLVSAVANRGLNLMSMKGKVVVEQIRHLLCRRCIPLRQTVFGSCGYMMFEPN